MNSSVIDVRDERTHPLLDESPPSPSPPPPPPPPPRRFSGGSEEEEEEISPSNEDEDEDEDDAAASSPPKPNINSNSDPNQQRLVSLDVFRGLTVALMIIVDDAGGAFPSINHSPWFGMTIADFVMPFFLFGVGISVGLVFKRPSNKITATKKVILRAIKLFALGVVLQGGYFHGRNHLTYGVDITHIRWLGVLQRISIGYLLAAISEIWLAANTLVDSIVTLFKKYYMQWIVVILICLVYMGLLYGLYVPTWEFEVLSSTNSTLSLPNYISGTQVVNCNMRSSLEPPCNAVGFIDRFLLGEKHLYQRPVYRRTKECSVNSPDYGDLPPNSPGWCLAPFDPEGILSSLMAATTCFFGLHYGHIIVHFKNYVQRKNLWLLSSFILVIVGYAFKALGMPVSKPLYTLSYMCITTGASGIVFTIIYFIVDVSRNRKPTLLFQWMGMNALIVYALAACEIFPAAIQGFYWRSPENNLVNGTQSLLELVFHSKHRGTQVFVLLEIVFWGLVAGYLHLKGIYVKL